MTEKPEPPRTELADLLDEARAHLVKYIVFPDDESADALTLFDAQTWASPDLSYAPRLIVQSPRARCGKTRLIADVNQHLVRKPMKSVNISAAAIVHSIKETDPPTIIMDETDTVFSKTAKADEKADLLRGILNSGFGRGVPYVRWDPQGRRLDECPTFAPAVLSGINNGKMPDTILDRGVTITLHRKRPDQKVERYRERIHGPLIQETGDKLGAYVQARSKDLADAFPALPEELNDRAQDVWESLLAIADAAGGNWPARARKAALKLAKAAGEDEAESHRLLSDLRDVLTLHGAANGMHTAKILEALHAVADGPWADWFGSPLNARDLSTLLRPYGVRPKDVKINGIVLKGYRRDELAPLWASYIPAETKPDPDAAGGDPEDDDGLAETEARAKGGETSARPGEGGATSATSATSQVSGHIATATEGLPIRYPSGEVADGSGLVAVAETGVAAGQTPAVAQVAEVAHTPPSETEASAAARLTPDPHPWFKPPKNEPKEARQ